MKTITKTCEAYSYAELDKKAREKAIAWFAEGYPDNEWWDSTYEDAERIGLKLTSFDLDRNRHAKGRFINDAIACAQAIIKEHGETCETYKTARAFLKLMAGLDAAYPECEKERLESDFLKSLLGDYSMILQRECNYLQSREHIEEMLRINDYEFTKEGKRLVV